MVNTPKVQNVLFGMTLLIAVCGITSGAMVSQNITYQGKLTDASGNPLSGSYSVTFNLYDAASGGITLATDTHSVDAAKGLFTTQITADSQLFDGRALWLGIKVGADSEMTPRQELRPVPYALGLRPGVVGASFTSFDDRPGVNISTNEDGSRGVNIKTEGFGSNAVQTRTYNSSSNGLWAHVYGNNSAGVYAISNNWFGVYGEGKEGGHFTTSEAGTPRNIFVGVNVSTLYDYNTGAQIRTMGTSSDGVIVKTFGVDSFGVDAVTYGDHSWGMSALTRGDDSPGVTGFTMGNDSTGVVVRTSGYFSPGVRATTNNASSNGMEVITKGDYSDGVDAHTEGYKSFGVDLLTLGEDSLGVHASTRGTKSHGVVAFTSGTNSHGVIASTINASSYGVDAVTEGDNSYGVRAVTSGSGSNAIYAESSHTSTPAIYATSKGNNSWAVYAKTDCGGCNALVGETTSDGPAAIAGLASGVNSWGVYARSLKSHGVYAETYDSNSYGFYTPDRLYAGNAVFPSADVAEYMLVTGNPASGTVVIIGSEGKLKPSTTAYDSRVAGIVSTAPGVTLGAKEAGNPGEALIAVSGRVPCNVDASAIPIHPGDLLTTSDKTGYAMKAEPTMINGRGFYPDGTILGKAMGTLESGTGTIEVLVTLQ